METTQAVEQFEFILDAGFVTILVGIVIPAITSLLTRINASKQVKAGLNIVLAGIASWFASATVADGTAVFTKEGAVVFGMGVVSALASYYFGYKPSGAADLIQLATPAFGIGGDKTGSEHFAYEVRQLAGAA